MYPHYFALIRIGAHCLPYLCWQDASVVQCEMCRMFFFPSSRISVEWAVVSWCCALISHHLCLLGSGMNYWIVCLSTQVSGTYIPVCNHFFIPISSQLKIEFLWKVFQQAMSQLIVRSTLIATVCMKISFTDSHVRRTVLWLYIFNHQLFNPRLIDRSYQFVCCSLKCNYHIGDNSMQYWLLSLY